MKSWLMFCMRENFLASTDKNTGILDWELHCCLVFGSISCKGSFVVDYHILKIVGICIEQFKSDLISKELKKL